MRSLRYHLGGRPRSFDDFLDLLGRQRPRRVTVRLSAEDLITEMYVRKQLVGDFFWEFPDGQYHCREYCGGFSFHESPHRQASAVRQANERLRRRLGQIRSRAVEVAGQVRFDRLPAT